jgi:hypothetical protein
MSVKTYHLVLILADELLLQLAGQLFGQGQLVCCLGRATHTGLCRIRSYQKQMSLVNRNVSGMKKIKNKNVAKNGL